MRRVVGEHGLSLFFLLLFLAALAGQAVAGHAAANEERTAHGEAARPFWDFVASSQFLVDVTENWQSEFLQFFLFIAATVWLVQRGSPESKAPGNQGRGSEEEQLIGEHAHPDSPRWARVGGWRTRLYSNSLLLVMGAVFALSWLAQSATGLVVANEEQARHGGTPYSWTDYLLAPEFWNRSLQNWQSELLAVGAMVGLSIFLRQRGSKESKPVGAPHADN